MWQIGPSAAAADDDDDAVLVLLLLLLLQLSATEVSVPLTYKP